MKFHNDRIHHFLLRRLLNVYVRVGQCYSQRIVTPKFVAYSEGILSLSQHQVPNPGYQIPSIFQG